VAVVIIEHPDSNGDRWQAALDLLIQAGREAGAQESPA
jgi:hypothetical protein